MCRAPTGRGRLGKVAGRSSDCRGSLPGSAREYVQRRWPRMPTATGSRSTQQPPTHPHALGPERWALRHPYPMDRHALPGPPRATGPQGSPTATGQPASTGSVDPNPSTGIHLHLPRIHIRSITLGRRPGPTTNPRNKTWMPDPALPTCCPRCCSRSIRRNGPWNKRRRPSTIPVFSPPRPGKIG